MSDAFDLRRFVDAQRDSYDTALAELRAGAKRSHWMWFVFPQVAGLGRSSTAQFYALSGLAEAQAYVAHRGTLTQQFLQDVNFRTVLGHGSGESFQQRFDGDGVVYIQPEER